MFELTWSGFGWYVLGLFIGVVGAHVGEWIAEKRKGGTFRFSRKGCSTCKYKTNSLSKGPCCFCNRNKSIDVLMNLSKISTAPLIKYISDNWEKNDGKA